MFRDDEIFKEERRKKSMETKDLQKLAYLYLCSAKDRKILTGNGKMKYCDFRRLTYLAGYIGFDELASDLWEKHGSGFKEELAALDQIQEEMQLDRDYYTDQEDCMKEEAMWVKDFLKGCPFAVRRWMQEYAAKNDPDWGTFEEIWEETMDGRDGRKGKRTAEKRKAKETRTAEGMS